MGRYTILAPTPVRQTELITDNLNDRTHDSRTIRQSNGDNRPLQHYQNRHQHVRRGSGKQRRERCIAIAYNRMPAIRHKQTHKRRLHTEHDSGGTIRRQNRMTDIKFTTNDTNIAEDNGQTSQKHTTTHQVGLRHSAATLRTGELRKKLFQGVATICESGVSVLLPHHVELHKHTGRQTQRHKKD